MIEFKKYKKQLIGFSVLIVVFILILVNFKSVGRAPELLSLSKSVAYPGDTVTLYGNYFGGEISKGRVIINDRTIFDSNILSWSDTEITFTLLSDFKSGMIAVKNMFGESESLLITSFNDVPRIKLKDEVPGYPFIERAEKNKGSEYKYILHGRNFGSIQSLSALVLSNESDRDGYTEIQDDYIVSWSDDLIEFYLPYEFSDITVYVKNSKGFSNYYYLDDDTEKSVSYKLGTYKTFNLKQSITVKDIVALKHSNIDLFVPCPIEGLNQKNIILNSREGSYNKKSNIFYYSRNIDESGEEYTFELSSSLDVYNLETQVNRSQIKRSYDKQSPSFKKGFETTPNVIVTDRDSKNTAVWLAKKNKNPYIKVELILNWVFKYIKLVEDGDKLSSASFKKRKGSEEGVVNLCVAMLRAAGIPSRIVKGISIEDGKSRNYTWFEFLLPGGAWVPVDFVNAKYKKILNIGNLDYNKIAFTKGFNFIEFQEDNFKNDIYALQNTVTNFSGNIERYNTVWHNVDIE